MELFFFSPVITIIVIVALVLWGRSLVNRVKTLENQVRALSGTLDRVSMGMAPAPAAPAPATIVEPAPEAPPAPETPKEPEVAPPEVSAEQPPFEPAGEPEPVPEPSLAAAQVAPSSVWQTAAAPKAAPERRWERMIGVTLPVWFGAIALALAGFFFVRYAIESGMVTPSLRAIACAAAAVVLLAGAELVRKRQIANAGPIAGALAAAAVATAYAAVYLASVVYGLVPQGAGFILMLVVTLGAIALALVYGQLVAIVGVLGGYLTPALYASDNPSVLPLFAYLTALLVAGFGIIRVRNWWLLTLPVLLGPAVWLLIWADQGNLAVEPVPPAAFAILIALVALAAAYPRWQADEAPTRLFGGKGEMTPELAVALAAVVSNAGLVVLLWGADYDFAFWQALGVLSALMIGLGFIWQALRYLKLYAMTAVALAVPNWLPGDGAAGTLVIGLFAVLFGFGALDQFRRLREPVLWASILAAVAVYFFGAALFKVSGWEAAIASKHLWALAALAIAGGFTALLAGFGQRVIVPMERERVYAIFAGAASAFLSMVVVLELDPVLFPAAAALQVLGLAAIYRTVRVPGLITVAIIYAGVYLLLLLGAGSGAGDGFMSAVLAKSIQEAPLVLLILPGAAFFGAATLLRTAPPAWFTEALDAIGMLLLALGIWYFARSTSGGLVVADDYENLARVLNPELLLALAGLVVGQQMRRTALWFSGVVLASLGAVALVIFGLLPLLSFWPQIDLGGTSVFNLAALSLGLPSLLLAATAIRIRARGSDGANYGATAIGVVAVLGLFGLVIIDIRHAFHPDLLQGAMSPPEYYAYSVGTLLFGLALLVAGVVLRNLNARVLSLIFVVAATVKVFVFDAAELEGLWRVASFLVMGLAFLGISWFYARFVFGITGRAKPAEA